MDPFFSLILLCIAMLVASFLAGNVPLSFHLSEDRLKLISNFGTGLLVGTALVVIIPEGVETLYKVPHSPPAAGNNLQHNGPIKRSVSTSDSLAIPKTFLASNSLLKKRELVATTEADHPSLILEKFQQEANIENGSFERNMLMTRQDKDTFVTGSHSSSSPVTNSAPLVKRQDGGEGGDINQTPGDGNADGNAGGTDGTPKDTADQDESNNDGHEEGEEEEEDDTHKYIGLALLSGFILMFLIDQMGPTHAHSHNNHVSVADFTELHNLQLDDSNIRMPSAVGGGLGGVKRRGNPITIGLVVHAAADGIALGASASRPELRFIVFIAIMLHKAPAAFGLSTVLLQHGFSRRQTRQQVAIFSLAAPIGAILTFIGQSEAASLLWWTGILLLFSGGTFLYVAMHVMSEMNNSERSNGGYNVGGADATKGLAIVDVLCVIGGMIVPLILSVDHEH
ncbi:hypothetical protein BGZ94_005904 [Podila epigama]|nr:hypothetical protein BGZ94_005904 [Podila epigama]